jgi:hypothetical protein
VPLTVPDLDLFLGGNDDLVDALAQVEGIDPGFDGLLDFVLVA